MIKFNGINKIYNAGQVNEHHVLKDITFLVKENQFTILRGPSGSGKSTILSIIGGLIKPTSGEVIVDDKSIAKLPDRFAAIVRQQKIGFIFQKFNLIPNLSALDNITVPLIPSKLSRVEINKRADQIMEELSISEKGNILVKKLSGGEQQRVAIARSLINKPKIILADEPTANLDRKLSLSFIQTIEELKKKGKTILLASHDPIFYDLECVDNFINIRLGEIK